MDTAPHPRWCQPDQCSRGRHAGRTVTIRSLDPLHPAVTAQLTQTATLVAEPQIVIGNDGGGQVTVTLGQARALGYTLVRLARAAGGLS